MRKKRVIELSIMGLSGMYRMPNREDKVLIEGPLQAVHVYITTKHGQTRKNQMKAHREEKKINIPWTPQRWF